ncbi:MAG: DNA-3-methyladenine glycosylase [Nitrospirales bacterium]
MRPLPPKAGIEIQASTMKHTTRTLNRNSKSLPITRRLRTSMPKAETLLWKKLRGQPFETLTFRRQHGIGPYVVDFYCPEKHTVIEIDGDVHAIGNHINKDKKRENYLRSLNLSVIRYNNDDVFQNLNGIIENLAQRLIQNSTFPPPLLTKEGHSSNHSNILPQSFFDRPTLKVAKELLGKYLLRDSEAGTIAAKIVDVEAYVGPEDKACHASKGRTKRTEVLFGQPGFTYVYLIYGMHNLLNFVTEHVDFPAAILIRGIEIVEAGKGPLPTPIRIDGPGRVCKQLGIDRNHNRLDVTSGQAIWVEDRGTYVPRQQIQALPRIGIDYAGEWALKPWRFCLPTPKKTVKLRTPQKSKTHPSP